MYNKESHKITFRVILWISVGLWSLWGTAQTTEKHPIDLEYEENLDSIQIEEVDPLPDLAQDTSEYQKISLDGITAFRHEETGEILPALNYYQKFEALYPELNKKITDDHWSQTWVNAYKDIELPNPFMVQFDQKTFTPPVDGKMVITSRFGNRRRGPHRGIDIDLVTGDAVRTVLPGKVRFVGYSRGHGRTVVVRHANDVETVYAHLSSYSVKVNDVIKEGQKIGLGGNTGNSRGSHLHLEVRYKGVCVHPEYVFNFDGSNEIRGHQLWVSNPWKNPRFHSSYRQSKIKCQHTHEDALAYEENAPKYYKVRRGDTLSKIARSNNLYLRQICSLNGISKNAVLRIGKILRIR